MSHPAPINHDVLIGSLIEHAVAQFNFANPASRAKFNRYVGEAMRDLLVAERQAQIEALQKQRAEDLQNWRKQIQADETNHRHRVLTTLRPIPNH